MSTSRLSLIDVSSRNNDYDNKERLYINKRTTAVKSLVFSLIVLIIVFLIAPKQLYSNLIVLVCHVLVIAAIFQANIANLQRLSPVNYRERSYLRKIQLWLLLESLIYGTGMVFFSNLFLVTPNASLSDFFPLLLIVAVAAIASMQIQDKIWRRHLNVIRADLRKLINEQNNVETAEFLKELYAIETIGNEIKDSSPDISYTVKNILLQRFGMLTVLIAALYIYLLAK